MVKEEINEVISFLWNLKIFKEMGVRFFRGVFIVGGLGIGKIILVFVIVVEVKVFMVEF